MISLKFLVGAVAWKASSAAKGDLVHSSFRLFHDGCMGEAVFGQIFYMATICWNLIWVVNFTLELYNPLRRTTSLGKWYHLFVWTISIGTGIAVGAGKLYGYVAHGGGHRWAPRVLCAVLLVAFATVACPLQRVCRCLPLPRSPSLMYLTCGLYAGGAGTRGRVCALGLRVAGGVVPVTCSLDPVAHSLTLSHPSWLRLA